MNSDSKFNLKKMVKQPKNLSIELFKHQLASIYRMEKLEREQYVINNLPLFVYPNVIKRETKLGIFADPTGSGKTLGIIGLIIRDKMSWPMTLPWIREKITVESAGLVTVRISKNYERLPATLILVSSSIIVQWKKELMRTDLKVELIASKKDVDTLDAFSCDVVLVTTSMYNYVVKTHTRYVWKRFIFDEPGHTRVSGMKEVQAGFYWLVTATPNAITTYHRNCHGSFMKKIIDVSWSDFETHFEHLIIRNDPQFVQTSFSIPKSNHISHRCHLPLSKTINGLVHPTITTMVEAGNIEGAITLLGGNKTKNIIELVRKKKKEELKEAEFKIELYQSRGDINQVRSWKNKRLHIHTQISELALRFDEMLGGNCFICYEKLTCPVLETNCQNLFCGKCLITWLKCKKNCPICRASIKITNLVYVKEEEEKKDTNKNIRIQPKTKIDTVAEIVQKTPNGKFLIFSSYDETFEPICRMLNEQKISFALMKGSSKTRQKTIDRFKKGDLKVIFLNSTFDSAGLNLQETTDLILYHEMRTLVRDQIIGRAERFGRKDPLRIHFLKVYI